MSFEWFVAKRYLRSPNRPAILRLITVFSILGVAAGVATLVIALAMNTGFRETLQDRLLGVTAHVSLTRPGSGGIGPPHAVGIVVCIVHPDLHAEGHDEGSDRPPPDDVAFGRS